MKRILTIISIALLPFVGVNAQDKEKNYLPEAGDMALGVNLMPVFKYAGNLFNGNTNNEIDYIGGGVVTSKDFDSDILPDVSIMGKYMLTDNWGLRANVGLLFRTDTKKEFVRNDKNAMLDPFDESKLIDTQKSSKNGMSLMLGAEYRTGKKRVQGVFGMGALFGFATSSTNYQYGNVITSVNQQPSSGSWVTGAYRPLSVKGERGFFYGLTGSAGVEWFVAPKVALGAEVNLSLYNVQEGKKYTKSEGYNTYSQKVETRTDLTSPGGNKFRFGTENLGGSLYMAFYF